MRNKMQGVLSRSSTQSACVVLWACAEAAGVCFETKVKRPDDIAERQQQKRSGFEGLFDDV